MLKIKDNVDLKELEKFGFEKRYNKFYEYNSKENIELTYMVWFDYRNLIVSTYDGDEVELDNTIYDLIQAGLVEKVEEGK